MSDIKTFIKEGGKSPVHVERKGIPLRVYNKDMVVQSEEIPMQNITDPTHIIGIYKIRSYYYAVISLFMGIIETPPLYFVPLIGDIIGGLNEIDTDCELPEEVRIYNFGYLVKKEPQQELVTPQTIDIANGSSTCVIRPVNDHKLIHLMNISKNDSALQKYIESEYRRLT